MAVIGRIKAAWIVGAVVVSVVVSGGSALAKSIPCLAATECVGTRKADTILAGGSNNVYGKNGNDSITDVGGASLILGGSGNDRITSQGGSSILDGGSGNDRIVALKGLNNVIGGSGNDAIEAKNGEADDIDCGSGKDRVVFDAALDTIANCESQGS